MKEMLLSAFYLSKAFEFLNFFLKIANESLEYIPGSLQVSNYVRNSYKNDPARVALEILLFFFAIKYLLAKRYKPNALDSAKLSTREIDELIEEWTPEPLAPFGQSNKFCNSHGPIDCSQQPLEILSGDHLMDVELFSIPVIVSRTRTSAIIETEMGNSSPLVNLCTFDVLGLSSNEKVLKASLDALRKYGVGSCGPPGFYGFADPHLQLQKRIAAHIGVPAAILYAQGFSAVSSVITAFSKRGDLLVVDEGIEFAAQKGVQISRSRVVYFRHNDMVDLEKKLEEIDSGLLEAAKFIGKKSHFLTRFSRKMARKFIVVEGIYAKDGTLAPLPKIIELKQKYKYRLILDDCLAYGVLGAHGAGSPEHFGVDPNSVDLILGQMGGALGCSGGFCASSVDAIEHQSLSSPAYCFSAAMPPMMASAGVAAISVLCEQLPNQWTNRIAYQVSLLRSILEKLPYVLMNSSEFSPYQHLNVIICYSCDNNGAVNWEKEYIGKPFKEIEDSKHQSSTSKSLLFLNSSKNQNIQCIICQSERASNLHNSANHFKFLGQAKFLQAVVNHAKGKGLLTTRAKYNIEQELTVPRPSIRINLSVHLSNKEIEVLSNSLKESFEAISLLYPSEK